MTVKRTPHAGGVTRLVAALRELDGVQAKTGWFETAKYKDGTPVALVAAIHEFGAPGAGIPARPFMRPTVAEKREAWMRNLEAGATEVLRGNMSASAVLEAVAMRAAGDISKAISRVTSPPLSPITIKRKGSAKPLVETGLLRQSVTGIVERV